MLRNCSLCSAKFSDSTEELTFTKGRFVFCHDCWQDLKKVVNVPSEKQRKAQAFVDAIIGFTPVVINRCYGGFNLSYAAKIRYLEMCGKNYQTAQPWDRAHHLKWGPDIVINGNNWDEHMIDRDDPYLVAVVRELGDKSWGYLAELKIVDVPSNVEWEIHEYDGMEVVAETHRTWV